MSGGFQLYPSIDLRDGKCVRLYQGDFDAETVYDDDPVRVARDFEAAGAQWIHVVDLDAARTGEGANLGGDRSDLRQRVVQGADRRGRAQRRGGR